MDPSVHNTRKGWWVLVALDSGDGQIVTPLEIHEKDRKDYRKLGTSSAHGAWGAPLYDLEGAAKLRAKEYTELLQIDKKMKYTRMNIRFVPYGRFRVLVTPNVNMKDNEE